MSLNPGENKSVSIQVPNRNLSVVTSDGTRKIIPGELQIWVGDGQPVARAGLAKAAGLLDRLPSGAVRLFRSESLPARYMFGDSGQDGAAISTQGAGRTAGHHSCQDRERTLAQSDSKGNKSLPAG